MLGLPYVNKCHLLSNYFLLSWWINSSLPGEFSHSHRDSLFLEQRGGDPGLPVANHLFLRLAASWFWTLHYFFWPREKKQVCKGTISCCFCISFIVTLQWKDYFGHYVHQTHSPSPLIRKSSFDYIFYLDWCVASYKMITKPLFISYGIQSIVTMKKSSSDSIVFYFNSLSI